MYSRFSKKEVVALSITSATTLAMASVLFFASAANTPSAEDFMADLEQTFQPPVASTKPTTTNSSSSNTTTSNSNSSSNSSSSSNTTPSGANTSTSGSPTTSGNGVTIINSATTSTVSGSNSTATTSNTTVTPTTSVVNAPATTSGSMGATNSSTAAVSETSAAGTIAVVPPLNSALQCNLPAIDILQTEELDTKTVVRWRNVPGAVGYHVMKRSKSGEFVLIERVTEPIYTAHLARGSVKYEDFKVAAVCGDTESASVNTSQVTSVKTGPVHVLILIVSLLLSAAIVLRKRFVKN